MTPLSSKPCERAWAKAGLSGRMSWPTTTVDAPGKRTKALPIFFTRMPALTAAAVEPACPRLTTIAVLLVTEEDYEQTDCTKAGSFQTWHVKTLNGGPGGIVPLEQGFVHAAAEIAGHVVSCLQGERPLAPVYGAREATSGGVAPDVVAGAIAVCEPEITATSVVVSDAGPDRVRMQVDVEWSTQ